MPLLGPVRPAQWQIQSPRFGTTRRANSADFNAANATRSPSSNETTIQPGNTDSRSYRALDAGSSVAFERRDARRLVEQHRVLGASVGHVVGCLEHRELRFHVEIEEPHAERGGIVEQAGRPREGDDEQQPREPERASRAVPRFPAPFAPAW